MKVWSLSLVSLFIFSACASTQHSEVSLATEAKAERKTEGATETSLQLIEILNQDSSITESERSKLVELIETGFAKKREIEVLANQKKALIVREYIKKSPDKAKIRAAKASIKKLHAKNLDEVMAIFDKMSEVMKLHPQSADEFLNRTIRGFDRF